MKSTKGRIVVVLLALVCLLAGMANGEGAAWDCPECGRKGNTGKFCGNCAHPAPEASSAYAVGDIITFGHYEQDNNLNNGQEAIEWIVLDYDAAENKALILSRYGLDSKLYHERNEGTTWEKCNLRGWLNGEFLKTAFTAEEQQEILKRNIDNSKSQGYSVWNSDSGNDTVDHVFLLSYREAFEEYFKDDESRTCKPTAYAIAQGARFNRNSDNGWWWLRSPGDYQRSAADVDYDGSCDYFSVYYGSGCIRPALWLNLETHHSEQKTTGTTGETEQSSGSDSLSGYGYTKHMIMLNEEPSIHSRSIRLLKSYALCRINGTKEADGINWYEVVYNGEKGYINGYYFKHMTRMELEQFLESPEYLEGLGVNAETTAQTVQKTYSAGDIIIFGHYEQDNNLKNGQEAIEWIVLDYDAAENKALLLSRYGLDSKPYHERNKSITWETSSLRSWLNGDFLKTAFTAEEQQAILKTKVDNSKSQGYSIWNTNGGNDTVDQVFLLSYQEAFEEYFNNNQSRICKPTAYAKKQGAFSITNSDNGWWWLRSPGREQDIATIVDSGGSHNRDNVYNDSGCIRPAMWLNLDSGT